MISWRWREADLDPVVELCTAKAHRHGSSTCLPHTFIQYCNAFYIVFIYYCSTIWFTAADLFHWRPRSGVDAKHCKAFEKFAATKNGCVPKTDYTLNIPWLSHGPHGPHGLVPSSRTTPRKNPWGQESKSLVLSFFLTQPIGYEKIKDVKCWSPLELVSDTFQWLKSLRSSKIQWNRVLNQSVIIWMLFCSNPPKPGMI